MTRVPCVWISVVRYHLEVGDCVTRERLGKIREHQSDTVDVQVTMLLAAGR